MSETKCVGVLTGGGDAPGLNPAIKGLVYRGAELGLEVIGLYDGWRSLLNPRPEVARLDALVVCGGEDTQGVAARFAEMGVNVVGVPKTIDKDLAGTDYTLGFDTALRNVTQILERSRTPAGSHGWVQIIEVMGRHAGHL